MKKRKDTASTPVVALNSCIWKKNLFIILVLVLPIAHFFVFWLYPNIDGTSSPSKICAAGKNITR